MAPTRLQAMLLTGRGVAIETARRKDVYVLGMLAGIYVIGTLITALVGVQGAATLTFLLNLGITFAWLAAHLVALLTAARQIPDELENRTLHPLLAKPVRRADYLLGKWGASVAAGTVTFALLLVLSMFPWLFVTAPADLDLLLFLQGIVIAFFSITVITAFAMLLSLLAPKPVNVVVLLLVLLFGKKTTNLFLARAGEGTFGDLMAWLFAYVPDFSKLNLFDRYTDGVEALGAGTFLGLVVYGLVFTAAPLMLALHLFQRRPL